MGAGPGRIGRVALLAAIAASGAVLSREAGAGDLVHDYVPPRGHQAIGYGPEGLSGLGYGHGAWYAWPYRTKSALYGYPDFAYGRGPLINLGGASLQPGFRGYGMFGSPGYGLGMYPSTWTDQRPVLLHGHGHRRGR